MKREKRDTVEMVITGDRILLRSGKPVDPSQAWFWTPDWKKAEHEASEDFRHGRTRTYKTEKDFLRSFAK